MVLRSTVVDRAEREKTGQGHEWVVEDKIQAGRIWDLQNRIGDTQDMRQDEQDRIQDLQNRIEDTQEDTG
jgi:hypothetical protein